LHHSVVIGAGRQLTTTLRIRINAADQCIELFDLQQKTLQILFCHRFRGACGDPDNPLILMRSAQGLPPRQTEIPC
jgi:hypothetical protein